MVERSEVSTGSQRSINTIFSIMSSGLSIGNVHANLLYTSMDHYIELTARSLIRGCLVGVAGWSGNLVRKSTRSISTVKLG